MPTNGTRTVVVGLLGLAAVVRAWRKRRRRNEDTPEDDETEKRIAATRETERRMAAYLRSRDQGRG
jgi:MYXO-CTERM domain-containing protein